MTVVTSIRVAWERLSGRDAIGGVVPAGDEGFAPAGAGTTGAGTTCPVHPVQKMRRRVTARHRKKQENPVRVCIEFHRGFK